MNTLVICKNCEKANRVPLERAGHAQPICGNCKAELPIHDGVQEISGSALSVLIRKSEVPVVVDFWAPWCVPCRSFAPTFQSAAQQLGGRAVFAKLDTQAFPMAGDAYHVRSVPTLIVFKNGAEVARQSGAVPLPNLLQYVSRWAA